MAGVAALTIALAVSGCGRRGDPLPPPDPSAPKPVTTNSASTTEDAKSVFLPGGGYSSEHATPIVPPKQPFALDPLIK